jgi:hypothetical protein
VTVSVSFDELPAAARVAWTRLRDEQPETVATDMELFVAMVRDRLPAVD